MRRRTIPELLTPSQEAVYGFVAKSTRWLTAYHISMLTGVSLDRTKAALKELKKMDLVESRTCIEGFDNGDPEFKAKRSSFVDWRRDQMSRYRLFGVEPLSVKLARIMGTAKAREFLK